MRRARTPFPLGKGAVSLFDGVESDRWQTVCDIVACINGEESNYVSIVEKKWDDTFKEKYLKYFPLDLSKIETWSTYSDSGCIDLKFKNNAGKLYCTAKIYDVDNFGGRISRKRLRFAAELILPVSP